MDINGVEIIMLVNDTIIKADLNPSVKVSRIHFGTVMKIRLYDLRPRRLCPPPSGTHLIPNPRACAGAVYFSKADA